MKKIITYFSFFSLLCLLSGCQLVNQVNSNRASQSAKEEFIERLAKFTEPNDKGLIGIKAERQDPDGYIETSMTIIDTEKSIWRDNWESNTEAGVRHYGEIIIDDYFMYSRYTGDSEYLREERDAKAESVVTSYSQNRKDALAYLKRLPEKSFYSKEQSVFMDTAYVADDRALYALSEGLARDYSIGSYSEHPILLSDKESVYMNGNRLVFEWKDGGKTVITAFSPTDAPQRPDNYYVESEEE